MRPLGFLIFGGGGAKKASFVRRIFSRLFRLDFFPIVHRVLMPVGPSDQRSRLRTGPTCGQSEGRTSERLPVLPQFLRAAPDLIEPQPAGWDTMAENIDDPRTEAEIFFQAQLRRRQQVPQAMTRRQFLDLD